jgi:hypothetical protein
VRTWKARRTTKACTRQRAHGAAAARPIILRRPLQVKPGVERTQPSPMKGRDERISLATSSWNHARPMNLDRVDLLGYAIWPVLVVAALIDRALVAVCLVVYLVASLFVFMNQRQGFFTRTHVHAPRGWFQLRTEAIPIEQVDDVVVEPVSLLPGMGTINVRYGRRYLEFPCVPDCESKATRLRLWAEEAVQERRKNQGAVQQGHAPDKGR